MKPNYPAEYAEIIVEKEKLLKTCPFCGSGAFIDWIPPHTHVFVKGIPDCDGASFVFCENCSAAIAADTIDKAIESWNKRVY